MKIQKQSHSRDTGWSMRDAEKWNSSKVRSHVRSGAALIIDRLRRGKCGAMAVTWGRTEMRRPSHVNNLPG